MFQFSGLAPLWVSRLHREGFTYSEIFGLATICVSPKLIAAYHVLHRLREPRHPPCALNYFFVRHQITMSSVFSFNMSKNYFLFKGTVVNYGIEPLILAQIREKLVPFD